MRIKKRYIVIVICWVIFIFVILFINREKNNYDFSYMNQAGLVIDNNYDGKIELLTPNPELSSGEKGSAKKIIANTYVYSGADSTSSTCGELKKGDEITVYSKSDGWYKISYNGRIAYVLEAAIDVPQQPTTQPVKPTTKPTTQAPTKPRPTEPPTTQAPTEPTQPSEEPTTDVEEDTSDSEEDTSSSEETTTPSEEESSSGEAIVIPGGQETTTPSESSTTEEEPSSNDNPTTGEDESEGESSGEDLVEQA